MAPSLPLMISIKLVYSYCSLYHCQTIFGVDTYIYIVVDIFFRSRLLFFNLFPFSLTNQTIGRWFPIDSGKMYTTMKPVIVPLYCIFILSWSIIKSNNFGCFHQLFVFKYFLRGALTFILVVTQKKSENIFLAGRAQICPKKAFFCLLDGHFAAH